MENKNSVPQGDDEGLLTDIQGIAKLIYKLHLLTDVESVLKEKFKAQRDLTRQERLDRPDREKIAKLLAKQNGYDWKTLIAYGESGKVMMERFLDDARQIKALIPDEEEIRKSERDKLFSRLISDGAGGYYFRVSPREYESFKKGE